MSRPLRQRTILRALETGAQVGVGALAELTGVSAVTVRRDLAELEAGGALQRTRGGARRAMRRGDPLPFAVRSGSGREAKQRIAAVAAGLVGDHESVLVDNGTSCCAVAVELVGRPLTVLALSLHAAAALARHPGCSVLVPGGQVEPDTLALTGSTVLDAVRGIRADVALLGACSVSAPDGLTCTSAEDAALKRSLIASSARRVLVSTADKLARSSTFRFGDLADLTHLVTTEGAPAELLAEARAVGVDVRLV